MPFVPDQQQPQKTGRFVPDSAPAPAPVAAPAAAQDDQPSAFKDILLSPFAGLETGLHTASNFVAPVAGNLAGLGVTAEKMLGMKSNFDDPDIARQRMQKAMTYEPRGTGAKGMAGATDTVMSLPGKAVGLASKTAGDLIRGGAASDTARGAAGNLVEEGINQGAGFLLGKGVKAVGGIGDASTRAAAKAASQEAKISKNLTPQERAATMRKNVEQAGFGGDVSKLSDTAAARAAAVDKTATNATQRNAPKSTVEDLGEQARKPISDREKALIKKRTDETAPLAEQARQNKTPIPTQHIIDFLREKAKGETAQGKAMYGEIARELRGKSEGGKVDPLKNMSPDEMTKLLKMSPEKQNAFLKTTGEKVKTKGISSANFENRRAFLDDMKKRKIEGQPINQVRAEVIDQAKKMLEASASSVEPNWGEFLDKYKEHSAPLDAFRRQEGAQIGKITEVDPLSGKHEVPSEKVVDHLIEGGATRIRAAMEAGGNSPEIKSAVEGRLWQQVQEMSKNNKMTPSAMDSFMQKHGDVIKEIGAEPKFNVARAQLKASEAIENTAIGKIAKSQGNAPDTFATLGKILRSGEGQRAAGLTELKNLTASDPEARMALRHGIAMHLVTEDQATAQLSRKAIMPDLQKSGLFTPADIKNIESVTQKFDQLYKIGLSKTPKTVMEHIISNAMKAAGKTIPFGKSISTFLSGTNDMVLKNALDQSRNILTMAAVDPEVAKNLLSSPTPQTIKKGLTDMQKMGVYVGVNQASQAQQKDDQ